MLATDLAACSGHVNIVGNQRWPRLQLSTCTSDGGFPLRNLWSVLLRSRGDRHWVTNDRIWSTRVLRLRLVLVHVGSFRRDRSS